ncbi:hypothetical protein TEA_007182 [Camellia sinensis var. sinensis]|uniref:Uncharacterized protein n=1 Tax=Camellia sinensis var. sinensis TaxID=542762 RepID=A0A4S4E7E9_CAMSN|nr:hypothetical protein TEA_007182 [Camellia sinensis var. sinensis]
MTVDYSSDLHDLDTMGDELVIEDIAKRNGGKKHRFASDIEMERTPKASIGVEYEIPSPSSFVDAMGGLCSEIREMNCIVESNESLIRSKGNSDTPAWLHLANSIATYVGCIGYDLVTNSECSMFHKDDMNVEFTPEELDSRNRSLNLQVEESKLVFEAKIIQRMELLVLSTLQWKMNSLTHFHLLITL